MSALEEAKKQVIRDIKILASEFIELQSFSGIIALEPKLEKLKERLSVLKYLEKHSIAYFPPEESISQPKEEKEHPRTNLSDLLNHAIDEDTLKALRKKEQLRKVQLDLNDKIGFSRQLFQGNRQGLEEMMIELNSIKSPESIEEYLEEKIEKEGWKEKKETIERLKILIEKRFRK